MRMPWWSRGSGWRALGSGAERITRLAAGFHQTMCYKSRFVRHSGVCIERVRSVVQHRIRPQDRPFFKCLSVCLAVFIFSLCHSDTDSDLFDAKLVRELPPTPVETPASVSNTFVVDRREHLLPLKLRISVENHLCNVETKKWTKRNCRRNACPATFSFSHS